MRQRADLYPDRAVDYTGKPHRKQDGDRRPRLALRCFAPSQLGVWLGLGLLSLLWFCAKRFM